MPLHPIVALSEHARRTTPDAPAVEATGTTLTYADLGRAVDAAAGRLTAAGVRPGDRVLVEGARTVAFVAGLLAVWRTGAVPAPVDGAHPAARMAQYRTAAAVHWTLPAQPGAPVVRHSADADAAPPPMGELSHVLFTSGTSGTPAAVAVGPAPLAAMIDWYTTTFGPTRHDRVPLIGGLGHDPLLRDLVAAFAGPGTLVVPEPATLTVPGRLAEFLADAAVTVLHCTPALLEFGLPDHNAAPARSTLRLVLCGGAPLPTGSAAKLSRLHPAARILNVYGATETPQVAAAYELPPPAAGDDLPGGATVPIGRGVAGAEVLLAAELLPTATDVPGDEIVVRSPHLALGYLNPGRDGGRFRPDPRREPGYRLYLTGDLGARDGSGALRVVGRADRQISLNGHRCTLQEIEAAALGHPDVTHATATMADGPLGPVLALHVAVTSTADLTTAQLRQRLREHLPSYAVPSAIRFATAAMTANHKTDLR